MRLEVKKLRYIKINYFKYDKYEQVLVLVDLSFCMAGREYEPVE